MIVHGHREGLLRLFLPNAELVELPFDFSGLEKIYPRRAFLGLGANFFIENVFADENAIVADVHPRALDQRLHFRVGFSAETAQGNLCGSRHGNL